MKKTFLLFVILITCCLAVSAAAFDGTLYEVGDMEVTAPAERVDDYIDLVWANEKGEGGAQFSHTSPTDGYVRALIEYDCAHILSQLEIRVYVNDTPYDFSLTGYGNGIWGTYFTDDVVFPVSRGENRIRIASMQGAGPWDIRLKSVLISETCQNQNSLPLPPQPQWHGTKVTAGEMEAAAPAEKIDDYIDLKWTNEPGAGGAVFTYTASTDGYTRALLEYDCAHVLSELRIRVYVNDTQQNFTLAGYGNGAWGTYHTASVVLAVKQGKNQIRIASTQQGNGWNIHLKSVEFSQTCVHPSLLPQPPRLEGDYVPVDDSVRRDVYADTWVGADGLGRVLPTYESTGASNNNQVGMFYFLWHDRDSANPIYDHYATYLTQGLQGVWNVIPQGPLGYGHYWGEPYFGYYRADDEWIIRKHAAMLSNAGVDFIFFDCSNSVLYPNITDKIFAAYKDIREHGGSTPNFTYFLGDNPRFCLDNIVKLYNYIYAYGDYQDFWVMWEGKPLILANTALFYAQSAEHMQQLVQRGTGESISLEEAQQLYDKAISNRYLLDYFTIRRSWAFESGGAYQDTQGKGTWLWADTYPQAPGFSPNGALEQMIVMCGFWSNGNGGRSNSVYNPTHYTEKMGSERGLVDDFEFSLTQNGTSGLGLAFQDHWERALEQNPPVVMVTGWNEWWAGRWEDLAHSQPIANTYICDRNDPLLRHYYVDNFNPEFSRDLEPMKGGFEDQYYYQLVSNVRYYKGVRPVPVAYGQKKIDLAGDLTQWTSVGPEYRDNVFEITERHGVSSGGSITYTNQSGRCDIAMAKVSQEGSLATFYVETTGNLPAYTIGDETWMNLWIDTDRNPKTGWNGYDVVVNRSGQGSVLRYGGSGFVWKKVQSNWQPYQAAYHTTKQQLILQLDLAVLAEDGVEFAPYGFDFKWTDHCISSAAADPMQFMDQGEAAPDDRFNFRYQTREAIGTAAVSEKFNNPLAGPNWKVLGNTYQKIDFTKAQWTSTAGDTVDGIASDRQYGTGTVVELAIDHCTAAEDGGFYLTLRADNQAKAWESNGLTFVVQTDAVKVLRNQALWQTLALPEADTLTVYDKGDTVTLMAGGQTLANLDVADSRLAPTGYLSVGGKEAAYTVTGLSVTEVAQMAPKMAAYREGTLQSRLTAGRVDVVPKVVTDNTVIARYSADGKLKALAFTEGEAVTFTAAAADVIKTFYWDDLLTPVYMADVFTAWGYSDEG